MTTSKKQDKTAPADINSGTARQDAPRRYIQRQNLQALLEKLFPNHKDKNFHIRLDNDVWSFDAPRTVIKEELEEAED
ncbi:hypothetical protein K432DRAFT_357419 [Lepidopterella palustris CBS 459.81]|uniref:Uncharacterized protein n=1 Tax=Lepidopterella palustris CBS 459.81 TaxID=1314670 RepID=A0A8E2E646_9PEZI|nr:hypothetical protein K432DRAFT_357419 [Lepidopterella palustris CBS 459.81]